MSNERVQFNLTERFAAPLPEFYRRRIIFWKDEDREFEKDVDELNLEGVKIIKLTGTNNFAVKKLLLHDDLESDYLVYCPITYTSDEDNWLQDIEYYSETFRADFISMQMDELNIAPSAAMRKTVKLYAKFFDSKERIQKLRRMSSSPSLLQVLIKRRIVSCRTSASLEASKPSGSLRGSTPATLRKKKSLWAILQRTFC